MQCLTGLPGCVDVDCVCRCHDYASPGEPVCGAVNEPLDVTCNRRPHPPGTGHARLDGNHVHAWPAEPRCDEPAYRGGWFRCRKRANHHGERHTADVVGGEYTWGYVPTAVEVDEEP
jgi:hypothetical protein